MNYIEALRLAHRILQPANYLEIGSRSGDSLRLTRVPSIGIDPEFHIKHQIVAPVRLFKTTSDEFFEKNDVGSLLGGSIELSFIDGLHQVEYALRDFINLEENSAPHGAILIDDVLPEKIEYASRERHTQKWTGDVYRLLLVLQHYRRDLDIRVYDIDVKGHAVVSNLNPASRVLRNAYKEIDAALAAGTWVCSSVEEIRALVKAQAASRLETDLAEIRRRHRPQAITSHVEPEASPAAKNFRRFSSALDGARRNTNMVERRGVLSSSDVSPDNFPLEKSTMAPGGPITRSFSTFFSQSQLATYQEGVLKYRYRGVRCLKSPIDLAIYLSLLDAVKPRSLIEIGSRFGGSAKFFRDFCRVLETETTIVSIDLEKPPITLDGVRFVQGDVLALNDVFSREHLHSMPRPWLVIEDSAHTRAACKAALTFFAEYLVSGEWLVMEDGSLSDMGLARKHHGGPNAAIAEFFAEYPGIFEIGTNYCDMFGPNATYNPNGYLRRTSKIFRT